MMVDKEKQTNKRKVKTSSTTPVDLTISELEFVYTELSLINTKKPKIQQRIVKKVRNALLALVLESARR